MLAAQQGHLTAVLLLLADTWTVHQVFSQDRMGLNELTPAVLGGSARIVATLLEHVPRLGQVAAISQELLSTMVTKVLDEELETFLLLAGVSMGGEGWRPMR